MTARSMPWLAGALVGALVGCSEPDQFGLRLTWTAGPAQACPVGPTGVTSCTAIPMSCGARARLRIVDAVDDTRVYFTGCYDVPAGVDVCGLRELPIPAGVEIPNQMVRIQLLVWSTDALAEADLPDGADCPVSGRFDVLGYPQPNKDLQDLVPALGREIYFPVGQRELATLEMGCADVAQLDTAECRARSLTVDATVAVPGSWRLLRPDEAGDLQVSFGATVERGGDTLLLASQLTRLELVAGPDPRWQAELPGPIEGVRCLQVFEVAPGAIPVASCATAVTTEAGVLPVAGFWPDPVLIARVVTLVQAATGIEGFPPNGLVLGFVIDRNNQPVVGATVAPTFGTVRYPALTLDGWQADGTSASGIFVSTDALIGNRWPTTAPGLVDDGAARGGGIANHVTVVVVHMDPT
ncbi:MAG: hypothetical protein IPH44_37980 [Myxococcales bacterium]|nr:hypothetical protein [Myxococcales bacterium]MBK7197089.1 hypothetical protein [Myxococcales bacterium]MBP6843229.1 hypothetical protein [Kofleriaceae bacterium]